MKEPKAKDLRFVPMTVEQLSESIKAIQSDDPAVPISHEDKALQKIYKNCVKHPEAWLWYTNWRILLASDDTMLGNFNFKGSPVNGIVEMSCEIDKPYSLYENKRYGTDAINAMIKWAFSQPAVYFAVAETDRENQAAINTIKKSGFILMGMSKGKEVPRWFKEKPMQSITIYAIGLGISLGAIIGAALGGMTTGLAIGFLLGLILGFIRDGQDKTLRKKSRDLLK